ncbi:PREDICTED: protein MIZU-KUSSEI 1 [Nelumbo nucifera]|uniref:Protein MIZU-KUSSEI 1 n=2 Tax=Nelumbo nucifera TaxID=4432 RepID=A0A822Z6J6_NELNU|nr:PREDICTED: protein MIZU-KUSSEI 1 [Nelumbo nucifera]DAD40193.1 TPA_asm: hypothetical protein HUJ06_014516 [Nelumbo nucifera]
MGEPTEHATASSSEEPAPPPPAPPRPPLSLVEPTHKKKKSVFRRVRAVFRTFPILTPACKLQSLPGGLIPDGHGHGGTRVTGTLFGYRKGKVTLSLQENPRCLPTVVLELAMQTNVLQKEMSSGMVRIALECEKRPEKDKTKLLEEPIWSMFCNGKKTGFSTKRDASKEDLHVMELLHHVSMGAGVLPGSSEAEGPDGELAYMRAHFERVVGSKDSETLYMISPEGNNGPELSMFFVRI